MYQGQLILFVKADSESECQSRLDELGHFVDSVKTEGFIPGFYDFDVTEPDVVRERVDG